MVTAGGQESTQTSHQPWRSSGGSGSLEQSIKSSPACFYTGKCEPTGGNNGGSALGFAAGLLKNAAEVGDLAYDFNPFVSAGPFPVVQDLAWQELRPDIDISGAYDRAVDEHLGSETSEGADYATGYWTGFAATAVVGGVTGGIRAFANAAAKTGRVAGPARSTDQVLDSFRGLGPGRNSHVRTVGSKGELQTTFDAWIVGAERLPARGPSVPNVYRLPDGGTIQWRTSSRTGGPSIDIFPVNGRQRTVHLQDGATW